MSHDASPAELLDRVEQLSARVDALEDEGARELAQELVAAVVAMYGDGLRRIMATIEGAREAGATILDELAEDGAVGSLLLIHDLYPVSLEQRVTDALDTVRPYMESHGGNVELVSLEDGIARLALQGSCDGCAASRATLELAIKQALEEHAPDLLGLEVEGVVQEPVHGNGAVELPIVQAGANGQPDAAGFELPIAHAGGPELPVPDPAPAAWVPLAEADGLAVGALRGLQVQGLPLLVANVEGSLVAYRDACAACGEPLHGGELAGRMLSCRSCGADFDLRRAGRAAGGEPLQLTPVPLLEAGGVRVAV